MHSVYDQYGTFCVEFEAAGEKGMLMILPEMEPAEVGIKPTERYFIYCIHLERGGMSFIIEQDEKEEWYSDRLPPFIDADLVAWIRK